jgi:site-specific DNA-methyltransferase (adenine-specific)
MTEAYNIDCMEAMSQMRDNEFELAIVDPPYGIDFAKTHTGNGWIVRENKEWDKEIPTLEYFSQLARVSKDQIIWGANYMVEYLKPSMGWIFWDKGQREFSLADGELAFTSFDRALRVFAMPRGKHKAEDDKTGGKIHPTQKPIKLYQWLLKNYAKEGDRILDTHLGSGSSRIAAYDMGFDFVGYEIEKDYFEAQEKRFKHHIQQQTMFQPKDMYQ